MRRTLIASFLCFFTIGCVHIMADETLATKKQSFPAAGVRDARIDTSSGSLEITGRPGASSIEVTAVYKGRPADKERILDNWTLTMEVRGSSFYLKSEPKEHFGWGNQGAIDLTVTLPSEIALDIEDGSGGMRISDMDRDVVIEDGSGGIVVDHVRGNLRIDDGSGSIRVENIGGNLTIEDGSGGIDVRHVGGNVRIDDGSGSIEVEDVAGDLDIPSAGSGSLRYRDVRGRIDVPKRRRT